MSTGPLPKPSFSSLRRWGIGLNVIVAVAAVLVVTVLINYLSGRYFGRFYLSSQTKIALSPRTLSILHALTNEVRVTLYYDKDEPFYSDIAGLLKTYQDASSKVSVTTVDYYRDPGTAEQVKAKYNLGFSTNRNMIIFDCAGRLPKVLDGDALITYTLERVPNSTEREFRRKPVLFNGEVAFTAALLAVSNSKPFTAYYLQGHGEPSLSDGSDLGYQMFTNVLVQSYIQVQPLTLLGTNTIPMDCNLLIIAGPTTSIPATELDKIDQYLTEGGRLFALFNAASVNRQTGLEAVLLKWGIKAGNDVVVDPSHMANNQELVVSTFAPHPVVNSIIGSGLCLILPRPVSAVTPPGQGSDGLKAGEIVFSGEQSYLANNRTNLGRFPVAAVLDRSASKNAVTPRGTSRIVVVGDSYFLNNNLIGQLSNRDFASAAVNWLLERPALLDGVSPKKIDEYYVIVPRNQMKAMNWILLGAMPGGILLFGGLVWLRRRR